MQAAGEVSVRPHACVSRAPVARFQRSATAACTAMPPPKVTLSATEVDGVETRRIQQRVEKRVHAADVVAGWRRISSIMRGQVARVDDQDVRPPQTREHHAIPGQRKDVVQRHRCNEYSCPARNVGLPIHAAACSTFVLMLPCDSIAPLATPVVPPVYCRKARSSDTDVDGRRASSSVQRRRRLQCNCVAECPTSAPACAPGGRRS